MGLAYIQLSQQHSICAELGVAKLNHDASCSFIQELFVRETIPLVTEVIQVGLFPSKEMWNNKD